MTIVDFASIAALLSFAVIGACVVGMWIGAGLTYVYHTATLAISRLADRRN